MSVLENLLLDPSGRILVVVVLALLLGLLAFVTKARELVMRACRQPAPKRGSLMCVAQWVFALWFAAVLIGYCFAEPWRADSYFANADNLTVAQKNPEKPGELVDVLARQIDASGTLVALAISGGGSRAAYFAQTILRRLGDVPWPGKPEESLLDHINIISSVSGGSYAAAYFALKYPAHGATTRETVRGFFDTFDKAMSADLERPVLMRLFDPRSTLAMLLLEEPGARGIADAVDAKLGGGSDARMRSLIARAKSGAGPILMLNATKLGDSNPFVFTEDATKRPILEIKRWPDGLGKPAFDRVVDRPRKTTAFEPETFGNLADLRIADAVAASAAFPVALQKISLGLRNGGSVSLTDGGLVDNLGLLTLYSVLEDPRLYEQLRGRLKRIVIIAIDSETFGVGGGLLDGVNGSIALGEEAVHRFVIPTQIRSERQGPLGDELDRQEWTNFRVPGPYFFSYSGCGLPSTIPTRFRLDKSDRDEIKRMGEACVSSYDVRRLEKLLTADPVPEEKLYDGRWTESELDAERLLIDVALYESYWWTDFRKKKARPAAVPIATLTREGPFFFPPADPNGSRLAPSRIAPFEQEKLANSPYEIDAADAPDGGIVLTARPKTYRLPGRVSFYVEIDAAELNGEPGAADICEVVQTSVRGDDAQGKPVDETAPLFEHNARNCL